MRRVVLLIVVAITLSACAGLTIGPVDHECHTDPRKSQGSGCDASPFD